MREEPASETRPIPTNAATGSENQTTENLAGEPTTVGRHDTLSEFEALAIAEAEDGRKLKWSIGATAVVHGVLLMITFPQVYTAEPAAPEPPKVFVLQTPKYKEPEPEVAKPLPEQRTRRQPWPDPTPDDPEPLVTEPVPVDVSLAPIDTSVLSIPEAPPEPEPTGPMYVTADVSPPVKIFSPLPAYTEAARKTRTEGLMILQSIIDVDGNVTSLRVLKSLPMGLEQQALKTMKTWKFKPATLRGKPVAVYFNLTVNFQLQ